MRVSIELHAPLSRPSNRFREAERRREAAMIAKQIVVQMVQAGWRESEAALSLADAFDDYCLYLAEQPQRRPEAANVNRLPIAL